MKQLTAAWAASAAFVLVACGPNDDEDSSGMTFAEACAFVEGCEDPGFGVSGPTVAIWRVTVVNETDGSYHIRDVDEVDVAASLGPPPSPLGGQRALAALDADGEPLEVHLLNFADTLTWESLDAAPVDMPIDGPLSTVGYLIADPLAETLAIVQDDGTVDDFLDAPKLGVPLVQRTDSRAFETNPPPSACSHAQILRRGHDVAPMDPIHEALIRAGLRMMTPAHCAGVGRVVLVDAPEHRKTGGWVSAASGDLIQMNRALQDRATGFDARSLVNSSQSRAYFLHALLHEAAHTTHFLLNSHSDSNYVGDWAPSGTSRMFQEVDKMRLKAGLDPAWLQMHTSFEDLNWAARYSRPVGETRTDEQMNETIGVLAQMTPTEIAHRGFISVYGGMTVVEDFAETVAHPVSRELVGATEHGLGAQRADYGCQALNERSDTSVGHLISGLFTKLSMVRDMGMITQEQFDDCVGRVVLKSPGTQLALFIEDEHRATFGEVRAGLAFEEGHEFNITARASVPLVGGTTDSGEFTFRARPPWPPGINADNWFDASYVRGAFRVGLSYPSRYSLTFETRAQNHYATDGYALIAQASEESIQGTIIIHAAERTFAPLSPPQTMPAPYYYRFHLRR